MLVFGVYIEHNGNMKSFVLQILLHRTASKQFCLEEVCRLQCVEEAKKGVSACFRNSGGVLAALTVGPLAERVIADCGSGRGTNSAGKTNLTP